MLKKFTNWFSDLIALPNTEPRIKLMRYVEPEIKCFKVSPLAILPGRAHSGFFEDAAFDLFGSENILLQPNERRMVDTQLAFIIPDGFWIKLRERSGLANKGIHVLGGVIDSGYTGSVRVILYNSDKEPLLIPYGKACAQFTVEQLNKATIKQITLDGFHEETKVRERGCKGFGSSDAKR